MWGDVGRCWEMWGDVRRGGETWGDVGRGGERWGSAGEQVLGLRVGVLRGERAKVRAFPRQARASRSRASRPRALRPRRRRGARVEVRLQPRAACAEHGGETQVAAAALQVVLPRVQVQVPERVADAGHVGVHLHRDPRLGAVEDARLQPLELGPVLQGRARLGGLGAVEIEPG